MLPRAVKARYRCARKVKMLTRRRLLTGAALSAVAGTMPTSVFSQVAPPPPPPVVEVSANDPAVRAAGGAAFGKAIVIGGMIYVIRGIIGTQVTAFLYGRQSTFAEFLLWPFPAPMPSPKEKEYLRLALILGNTRGFREQIQFWIAEGKPVTWPQTTQEMRTAIRFYRRG